MGRHHIFSCRLSEGEITALESLLELADCVEECRSERFRSIILELDGRLYRDYIDNLKYKAPLNEPDLRDA